VENKHNDWGKMAEGGGGGPGGKGHKRGRAKREGSREGVGTSRPGKMFPKSGLGEGD